MIKDILGGGIFDYSIRAACGCNCEGKCTTKPGYSEGYRDGHTEQKTEGEIL